MNGPSRFVLALGLLAVMAPMLAAQQAQEGAQRLVLADGLFAREMFALAAQEYEAILREEPDLPAADAVHFRLGESYRRSNKILDADKQFSIVFNSYPKSEFRHRAGFRRAGLFMDAGHYDAAADLYRAVLKQKPPVDVAAACWYLQGEALLALDKLEEAVPVFQKVDKEFASSEFHGYALLKLGQIFSRSDDKKRNEQALTLFRRVADSPRDDRLGAEAWFQVAEWYFRRGAFDKSSEAYRRLGKSYPNDARTVESALRAAWAAHNAARYADALRLCDASPGTGTSAAEWLYLKANCQRQLLNHREAAMTYRALLSGYATSRFVAAARYELALALYKEGEYEAAIDEAEGLTGNRELQKDIFWLLAESHAAIDQTDDAVQYYRLIGRDFPDSDVACDATYRLAYHLQTRADFVPAAEQFSAVASRWPSHSVAPRALFASGYCWSRAGSDEKAISAWSALVQKHPKDPLIEEAMFQKAMSEVRLKRDSDALTSLRELRRRFPSSSFTIDAAYWEGRLLQQAERYADSEACLRTVLNAKTRPDLQREAQLALAYVLQAQDKDGEAAGRFQKLLGTPAGEGLSESLLLWLAQYQLKQKAHDKAMQAAQRLVSADRTKKWQQAGWHLLGQIHAAQGKSSAAVAAYEMVLKGGGDAPEVVEAALALGDAALAAKQSERARGFYEQAANHPAGSLSARARAYAGQGRAAQARGEFDTAARYFMSVAILYNDPILVPDCLAQAAVCLTASGNTNAATKALAELKSRYPDASPDVQ